MIELDDGHVDFNRAIADFGRQFRRAIAGRHGDAVFDDRNLRIAAGPYDALADLSDEIFAATNLHEHRLCRAAGPLSKSFSGSTAN